MTWSPGIGLQHSASTYLLRIVSSLRSSTFFLSMVSVLADSSFFSSLFLRPNLKMFLQFLPPFEPLLMKSLSALPSLVFSCPTLMRKASILLNSWNLASFSRFSELCGISSLLKNSLTIYSPLFLASLSSFLRIDDILVLALAVVTISSHLLVTCCELEMMTSTWSPLESL